MKAGVPRTPGSNDSPAAADLSHLQGVEFWVGPEVLQEGAGEPTGVFSLQDAPFFLDWERAIGDLAPYHRGCGQTEIDFSSPKLFLDTTLVWGDVVGAFDLDLNAYNPAEGKVDFNDVAAMTERFSNAPKAPPVTWCDLVGDQPEQGNLLNFDFLDISEVVRAFRGGDYPFDPPAPPDGGCP